MGFFSQLFGRPDSRESILRAGMALADETERVYRNQLEGISPTGRGLLKARLLSLTFPVAAYVIGKCAKTEQDAFEFSMACSGVAMIPLSQPGATPTIARSEAKSFAASFMSKAFKLIQSELAEGPSSIGRKTDAFRQLVEMYHHCLAESAGEMSYQSRLRSEMELPAESVMWTHFRFLTNMLQRVGK
jgi:hypothetical protein